MSTASNSDAGTRSPTDLLREERDAADVDGAVHRVEAVHDRDLQPFFVEDGLDLADKADPFRRRQCWVDTTASLDGGPVRLRAIPGEAG